MRSPRSLFNRSAVAVWTTAALMLTGLLISGTSLAEDCPLKAPLTLKDLQDGFAGATGTVWTVAPDCSFTVAHQIGPKAEEPYRRGRLTPEQQAHLKELLTRTPVANLPEQFGGGPQVNPRRITLSYSGKVSVLTLAPDGGDLNSLHAAAGDDPTGQLLGLAATLDQITGG